MRSANKKIFSTLACAGVMATTAFVGVRTNVINPKAVQVQAAKTNVSSRSYGVDVSSFQSTDLSKHAQAGSQFAIVKVSEGTSYRNPNAKGQIASALSNNMMPMAYHFATFGANGSAAVSEANYAISSAQAMGLPKGSYIACDWETGDGNNVNGGKDASANAILAFMNKISAAGYKPLLYSGAYLLRSNINTSTILAKYPNSLWVASYATSGRIDTPNFNYFPSMDGVAIWQFTDNWRGLYVDGNISLLPLSYNTASSQAPTTINTNQAKTTIKTPKTIMSSTLIYNRNGQSTGKKLPAYTPITVIGGAVSINGTASYQIGNNQYVPIVKVDGTSRKLYHNAYIYNNKGQHIPNTPTLKAGISKVTYGGIAIIKQNGVEKKMYRIGRNQYVKVANFSQTSSIKRTTKTVMSSSIIYDKLGKSLNRKISAYTSLTVIGNPVKIGEKEYYQIDDNQYVKAVNIDGTSRKLYHNAYIYNNKGQHIPNTPTLKAGISKVTYGGIAIIKQNGVEKKMYRIGRNQYVKVANFSQTSSIKRTTKTVMSSSIIYDKLGKSLNRKISAYTSLTVIGNPVKIGEKEYYQIDDNQYVKAVNIDGTSRKLYHNAYIYNNKGQHIPNTPTLKAGISKVTYGGIAIIKQNGVEKKMYRIGRNQYVKVANF